LSNQIDKSKKKHPHILFLTSWYPSPMWPSLGSFVRDQARALVRAGLNVNVIYPNLYSPKRIFEKKIVKLGLHYKMIEGVGEYQYYAIKTHIPFIDKLLLLRIGKKLFREFMKTQSPPDLIHLHTFLAGSIAMWIKKKHNIPYVVTEHFSGFLRGIISKQQINLARNVYSNSKLNIAVSEPYRQSLEKICHVPFHVIPNMVDTVLFTPEEFKHNKYTYISVGNLVPNKNHISLIEAFSIIYKLNNKIKLIIVGDGREKESLQKGYLI
jgi:glycosyltransferase involved in cell wall biosynthesis